MEFTVPMAEAKDAKCKDSAYEGGISSTPTLKAIIPGAVN